MRVWHLILILLLCACTSVPKDFRLEYGFGSCNKSWGWTQISIHNDGRVFVLSSEGNHSTIKEYQMDKRHLSRIMERVHQTGFMHLNSSYINPYVIGGMCSGLYVKEKGVQHKVEIANTPVPQVAQIVDTLIKAMDEQFVAWNTAVP